LVLELTIFQALLKEKELFLDQLDELLLKSRIKILGRAITSKNQKFKKAHNIQYQGEKFKKQKKVLDQGIMTPKIQFLKNLLPINLEQIKDM